MTGELPPVSGLDLFASLENLEGIGEPPPDISGESDGSTPSSPAAMASRMKDEERHNDLSISEKVLGAIALGALSRREGRAPVPRSVISCATWAT